MNNPIEDQAVQQECDGCNAEAGEECRPTCTGQATSVEEVAVTMLDFFGGNIISTYSRAQALADGVLVAVPEAHAQGAGFRWSVAFTAAAWANHVAWPEDADAVTLRGGNQYDTWRLCDVLRMARAAALEAAPGVDRLTFALPRRPGAATSTTAPLVALSLLAGPGDRGEPVLTICEPGED